MQIVICDSYTATATPDGKVRLAFPGKVTALMEALIGKNELALRLHRKPRTVKDWLARGCPHSKLDGSVRFRQSEVEHWLLKERCRVA